MIVDLYSLNIGDLFREDTFPQVWQVKEIKFDADYDGTVVIGEEVKTKELCTFFYSNPAYSPIIIKVG